MNQPWIYMCCPSQSPLPPPCPSHPSGSSQCTNPEHLSHASNLGWRSVSHLIVYLFQCCSLRTSSCLVLSDSCNPMTAAHPAPLSMGFSRHAYWSGLPSPPPGDFPNPGTESVLPVLQVVFCTVAGLVYC